MASVKLCIRIYIVCNGMRVAGRGLIEVLEAIRETGSLRGAARKLGINYKRLWSRVTRAERLLGFKLIEVTPKGSRLTPEAERLIEQFRTLEKQIGVRCVEVGVECR